MRLTPHGIVAVDKLSFMFTWTIITASAIRRRTESIDAPENEEYLALNDALVSEFVVCRVVDVYQQYNRNILKQLVSSHPELLESLGENLPLRGREIVGLINGTLCPSELIGKIQFTDRAVREHIHRKLGFWKESEIDYLIEARNCIVHADGWGFDSELKEKIQREGTPWNLPLSFDVAGRLILSPNAAMTSIDVALAQISIMDQGCANNYNVPSHEHEPRNHTLAFRIKSLPVQHIAESKRQQTHRPNPHSTGFPVVTVASKLPATGFIFRIFLQGGIHHMASDDAMDSNSLKTSEWRALRNRTILTFSSNFFT